MNHAFPRLCFRWGLATFLTGIDAWMVFILKGLLTAPGEVNAAVAAIMGSLVTGLAGVTALAYKSLYSTEE
jgi:hypothetical protein